MFAKDWTRKIAGFSLLVWALIVILITVRMLAQYPTLAEWGNFLWAAAGTAALICGISGGKSILTDAVAGLKAKGNCNGASPTP